MNPVKQAAPQPVHAQGPYPIIEIELRGNIPVGQLIQSINEHCPIPYKLLKADIEYLGKANFGRLLILLQGTAADTAKTLHYLSTNKIRNTIKGYA